MATKPNEFRKSYVLSTDVPYNTGGAANKGTHSGEGMLHQGRVVWLADDPRSADGSEQVPAYAEGVGVVLLASACMQPAS